MVDHDAFDVFLQRKNPHAFESVRAFISDAFRSRLIGVFSFFLISIGYDRPRAGSGVFTSVSGPTQIDQSKASPASCPPLIPSFRKIFPAWNGSETHPRFVTRRISRRRSARFHGRVDTSRLAGRGAVRACATLSAPQERRRIHASRFPLPRSSSRSWPP